ncbi:MAG: complex I NDUFA9 subunit family protein [Rhodospirillales bacterium]|nr:complex I NDUFA9 subunit family protein [Rhodospirillales bacterium]
MSRQVITIFGGSGFVGRHLVRRLAPTGWICRVAVRDPDSALFLKVLGDPGQIIPMAADVTDQKSVERAVADVQRVVNLVGILYEKGRRSFQRVHVEGAANVAKAASAAGVERLVQMSAIGADPESPAGYGRTKAAGEEAAKAAFAGTSVVRPSVVFGPEDDFFNRFAAMARLMPVLPVFPTRFQPVFVDDVAAAIATILDDPQTKGKTYELGGPRVITFEEFLELVMRFTGRKRMLLPLPLSIASLQATFLQLLPSPPLTRDQVRLLGRDNVVAEGALTLADLGITPTAMEGILPTYLSRFKPPVKQRKRIS